MAPKLGMGLYGDPDQPQGFNDANLQFARQLGCTHVTLHLPGHKLCPNENGWTRNQMKMICTNVWMWQSTIRTLTACY